MQRKSLGELPAFPMRRHGADALEEPYMPTEDGMSYRQWLIGQLGGGLASHPHVEPGRLVELVFQLADDIIGRMDAQRPA